MFSHMTLRFRLVYLLIALVPTHLVGGLVLAGQDQYFLMSGFLALALIGVILAVFFLYTLESRHTGRSVEIVDFENSDANLMSFLISFVPFFLDFDFSNGYVLAAFSVFYLTFFTLMMLTDGLMPSPLLYLFRWRVLDTWIKDGSTTSNCVVLVRRKNRIALGRRELVQIGSGRVFVDASG